MYVQRKERGRSKKMIKVVFKLNIIGHDEIVEFDDDVTKEEIGETYSQWVQELGPGWKYYEEE